MAADGQVTMGNTVMKHGAKKVRRLYKDQVLVGFAGATADAFYSLERFEKETGGVPGGNLTRAAVELAKDWRTDRMLRRLEALLLVANRETTLMLSGTGDIIEPDDGGSGDRKWRAVRPGRGAGAAQIFRPGSQRNRRGGHEPGVRNLHFYQPADYGRGIRIGKLTVFGKKSPQRTQSLLRQITRDKNDGLVKSLSVPLGTGLRFNLVAAAHL